MRINFKITGNNVSKIYKIQSTGAWDMVQWHNAILAKHEAVNHSTCNHNSIITIVYYLQPTATKSVITTAASRNCGENKNNRNASPSEDRHYKKH